MPSSTTNVCYLRVLASTNTFASVLTILLNISIARLATWKGQVQGRRFWTSLATVVRWRKKDHPDTDVDMNTSSTPDMSKTEVNADVIMTLQQPTSRGQETGSTSDEDLQNKMARVGMSWKDVASIVNRCAFLLIFTTTLLFLFVILILIFTDLLDNLIPSQNPTTG